MATQSVEREVETRLRDRDIRYTRARRAVVEALANSDGPKSAAALTKELGQDVPVSSLYRSLAVLEEAGVVVPHFAAKGLTRYELAEWLAGHHHHFVCAECGTVEDIQIPAEYEERVLSLVSDIATLVSFEPSNHMLEIEGRCSRCR
jgi:Fe2+ or Zn2+ uptake regulation protein